MKTFKEFLHEAARIGKVIGGEHYVHRNYESVLPDQEGLEKAKSLLDPEHRNRYTVVKYNKKEGTFSFIHSPDFDESDEPISGESHKVKPDGSITITKQKQDPQIWHHKQDFVADDYSGFDVEAAKQRSRDWGQITDKIKSGSDPSLPHDPSVMRKIGTLSYWNRMVVPHLK